MSDVSERELVLTRTLKAPRHLLWRCWTEPALLEKWFCPAPWRVTDVELDVHTGGAQSFVMRGPDGEVMPQQGVYLEVIENEKLVTTDAYVRAWEPSEDPFMTAIVTFEDLGNGETLYTARARHWSVEKKQQHEAMGFHEGWGICADQLEALAQTLK
ncbi:SRPBCC family protein [Asticcacaulis tiandongensis]|uniref:SRPBCC family protein n=1 Tax=Asticcacaulis tiandongensis TaxID=2565365 RepID=UPI00112C8F2E|nr:SRPBCC family protein [Asticcacaulis tiandongensis]